MKVKLFIDDEIAGEIDVSSQPVIVGRSDTCDVQIDDESVSEKHIRLFVIEDRLLIEDMGSSNGTILNGESLTVPMRVPDGAVICLGELELQVEVEAPSPSHLPVKKQKTTSREPQNFEKPRLPIARAVVKKKIWTRGMKALQALARKAKRYARTTIARVYAIKLKLFDLPQAYQELGMVAFQQEFGKEKLLELYSRIVNLENRACGEHSVTPSGPNEIVDVTDHRAVVGKNRRRVLIYAATFLAALASVAIFHTTKLPSQSNYELRTPESTRPAAQNPSEKALAEQMGRISETLEATLQEQKNARAEAQYRQHIASGGCSQCDNRADKVTADGVPLCNRCILSAVFKSLSPPRPLPPPR